MVRFPQSSGHRVSAQVSYISSKSPTQRCGSPGRGSPAVGDFYPLTHGLVTKFPSGSSQVEGILLVNFKPLRPRGMNELCNLCSPKVCF